MKDIVHLEYGTVRIVDLLEIIAKLLIESYRPDTRTSKNKFVRLHSVLEYQCVIYELYYYFIILKHVQGVLNIAQNL